MNDLISLKLRRKIDNYKKSGGKRSRRANAQRIERFIRWCGCPGEEIGRKHVHLFFTEKQFSATTDRDYFYSICKLWQMLDRNKEPPRPPSMR
ncbi:MAG: hypothetical protein U5L95_02715 [Candidatus Saccharibacteria bacterium]|nr:hypothetical protein [Candidatus Saccharibacteria bacterium]